MMFFSWFPQCLFSEAAVQVGQASFREFTGLLQPQRGQERKSRRNTKEAGRRTVVACLAPRLTWTVYCSTSEALGTSLVRIAMHSVSSNQLEKVPRLTKKKLWKKPGVFLVSH